MDRVKNEDVSPNHAVGGQVAPPVRCEWTVDNNLPEDDRLYSTACGEEFLFIDGSPKDNGLKFCCYCGKPIKGEQYARCNRILPLV